MSEKSKTAVEQPPELPQPTDENLPRIKTPTQPEGEIGGPQGPEPTRYGDWEIGGRCSDF
ncbi:MAG TPA: DUF1674 domain-containing protein [Alphaproteobacteria bacterium]|nr:DUF1674 domain-containing protein [Rhodospirillaceae bacterium]HRJ11911.1 DUF1674 domain-containing protein [Alphaproteobacteria bacterium]